MAKSVTLTSSNPRYSWSWLGHCTYEDSNKVWGWFKYMDPTVSHTASTILPCYVFWARVGKTPSFKKHGLVGDWQMSKLVRAKIDRSYNPITEDDVLRMWPSFYDDIDNKFLFHLLADDI